LRSGCLLLVGLLVGCTAREGSAPMSSVNQQTKEIGTQRRMTIDGQIVNVMETWPLQLTVQSGLSRYYVRLTEETKVSRGAQDVGPGQLRPSTRVRIIGQGSGDESTGLTATSIEILD